MKGKVTKDIILRVGQGIMRIPREKAVNPYSENSPANSAPSSPVKPKEKPRKDRRS